MTKPAMHSQPQNPGAGFLAGFHKPQAPAVTVLASWLLADIDRS
jgi:hypothetical protein